MSVWVGSTMKGPIWFGVPKDTSQPIFTEGDQIAVSLWETESPKISGMALWNECVDQCESKRLHITVASDNHHPRFVEEDGLEILG